MIPQPTTGFPVHELTNGAKIGFWWEDESEGVWLIYLPSPVDVWRGGGVFMQMGTDYLRYRGPGYLDVCIKQINDAIRTLFPALFPAVPVVPGAWPASLVASGPETVALASALAWLRLVDNQLVKP